MVMEGGSQIGVVMMRSTDDFFRNKMEECLELAKHAANEEDRAFWQRLAESWQERLRQLQRPAAPTVPNKRTRSTHGKTRWIRRQS
jgi:uncharacterized membrane protein YccC